MELHVVDNIVQINAPGARDQKRVFADVRAALDWVEMMVQTRPMKFSVSISDISLLFNGMQRDAFLWAYDVPANLRRSYFALSEYKGPLFDTAIQSWWIALGSKQRNRLQKKIDALPPEMRQIPQSNVVDVDKK